MAEMFVILFEFLYMEISFCTIIHNYTTRINIKYYIGNYTSSIITPRRKIEIK